MSSVQSKQNIDFNSLTPNKYYRIYPNTPDDEIVISGISGKFPKADDMQELQYNLYNKIDMTSETPSDWKCHYPELPNRHGLLLNSNKFDATFFGIHYKQAHALDPQGRMLIESVYESILDAGISPQTVRNTNVGVYIGSSISEAEGVTVFNSRPQSGISLTGCCRNMLANRISFCLGLTGPSFILDTACSSSLYALDMAFSAIRNGECESAIVGGTNLMNLPIVSSHFARLGVLSPDGYCKTFDEDASGYVRAAAIVTIFLQKIKDSKRCYAKIIYSKINCDGHKPEGITYPSKKLQQQLLTDFYAELKMDPSSVNYIEAHGTATVVGDVVECAAIENVFCKNRTKPLLIGSIKSNLGHSETSAGVVSIAKVILAFESGIVAPNLHYKKARADCPSLVNGKLKVCKEPTKLDGPLIGINAFGFGGANGHVLLHQNLKEKLNYGLPIDDMPRLVNWSGRTNEAVDYILNEIQSRPLDAEYIGLLHNIQSQEIPGFIYRGYGLFAKRDNQSSVCLDRCIKHYSDVKLPVVWVFSGMGSQWNTMGTSLLKIPVCEKSLLKSHEILKPFGVNLLHILTSSEPNLFDNILNSFVGISACQIALVDILKHLDIKFDYLIGHSVGELGCAYADGCFTAEQMLLAAYSRGMATLETKLNRGLMAAVGLGYKKIVKMLPSTIEVACHNSSTSVTISGSERDIKEYVAQLKDNGIFASIVNTSNIAYHSKYIADIGPNLMKRLTELIPKPKKRSAKWLSTSVPFVDWKKEEHQYCSAQYHTNNLLNSVLFEETAELLPQQHVSIEIAPHGLLQAILRKSMPNSISISLTNRKSENNLEFLFSALGKLFINGLSFPIEKIYPAVDFPVSRGTPIISQHIKWDHSVDWRRIEHKSTVNISNERKITINLSLPELEYLTGHIIDGRCLYPATAYICFVWQTFAFMKNKLPTQLSVEFDNIKFLRATSLTKDQPVQLTVTIQYVSGMFEISEGTVSIVTGTIREITDKFELVTLPTKNASKSTTIMKTDDFYKELRLRGYHYNGAFKSIIEVNADATFGKIKWDSNWVAFMDCMLQMNIISTDSRSLLLPTGIQKIRINPLYHAEIVATMDPELCALDIKVCHEFGTVICGGIEITNIKCNKVNRRRAPGFPILESYKFISHIPTEKMTIANAARVCIQLALENNNLLNIKCIEFDDPLNDKNIPIIQYFEEAVDGLPLVYADLLYLTSKENIQLGNHIKIDNIKLTENANSTFIIINQSALKNQTSVTEFSKYLMQKGYLLLRAKSNIDKNSLCIPEGFQLNAFIPTDNDENIIMYQKIIKELKLSKPQTPTIIQISSNDEQYDWLNQLQTAVKNLNQIILVAENDSVSGIIGLVNCIRKEPDGDRVICVFIDDPKAPAFDYENLFYKNQLKLGFAFNVYRNGKWGSYRHLILNKYSKEFSYDDHYYATTLRLGDLSSFTWFQGPLNINKTENIVRIHYSSLNFRDVMIATGRISDFLFSKNNGIDSVLGFEYSGIDSNGERIMGMVNGGAMATYIQSNSLTWRIPDDWSLKEAATVPVVYLTIYIAFFLKCSIKRGQSILIHAGSGGVGLGAIRIALAYGLEVFTTVSTIEKKEFIMKEYPEIKECNIGNSRDCSFEQMIKLRTNGKGVDYVLNSLSDDKLQASIRCIGRAGVFIEIGRFDLEKDTKIGLGHFLNDISFVSVHADNFKNIHETNQNFVTQLIQRDIKCGIIKPLPSTVFQINEIEMASRYMSTGRHIGKVMIQIRDDSMDTNPIASISIQPKVYCDPNLVYIIVGGLGGFGLELADWLISRGARKVVLSSSRGISNGYQEYRISIWKSYDCEINISTADITQRNGCKQLLEESLRLGPVGGIFNLAVCLKDSILENQTKEKFYACIAPKANATIYLDELSRKLCPQLKYFVVFSSVSCGRGYAGQSNYGMANSIMERIIEQRANCNLPAKAIQWGGIGEVGIVANLSVGNINTEIGGTLPQHISSCLTELDTLLCSHHPIVASMMIAKKKVIAKCNVFEYILNFVGIQDIKSISLTSPLSKCGLDSLAIVELRQSLERDFEIYLNSDELRAMTFAEIKALTKDSSQANKTKSKTTKTGYANDMNKLSLWIRNVGDEEMCKYNILRLPSLDDSKINNKSCILIFPGIEGVAGTIWFNVAKNITLPTYICQFMNATEQNTISGMVDSMKSIVMKTFKNVESFYLIGYSFGTVLAIEFAKILENIGMKGQILLLDGAPEFLKIISKHFHGSDDKTFEINVFNYIIDQLFPDILIANIEKCTQNCRTILDKINKVVDLYGNKSMYTMDFLISFIIGVFNRMKLYDTINENNITKIHSPITLIRPVISTVNIIEDDYKLSNYASGPINIKTIDGDHSSILDNTKLIEIINEIIEKI